MRRMHALVIGLVTFLLVVSTVNAQIHVMNFQGMLTDISGIPLTGTHDITFRIYSVGTGGTPLWQETQSVSVDNGVVSAVIGQTTFDPVTKTGGLDLDFGDPALFPEYSWLSIEVNSDGEMTPRQKNTSVPYAYQADIADYALEADTLDGIDSSAFVTNEVDPTVPANIKDGIDWTELSGIPADFADGTDDGLTVETDPVYSASPAAGIAAADITNWNVIDWTELLSIPADIADGDQVGILVETDPTVPANIKDGIDWTELSGIPAGFADGTDDGLTVETDPVYSASPAAGIAATDITNWNVIDWTEILSIPAGFADGVDNTGIGVETDPVYSASPAAGIAAADITNWNVIDWTEISSIPAGFADGVDNVGIATETDPQVGVNTTGYVPKWDGSALSTGTIYDPGTGLLGLGTINQGGRLHVAGPTRRPASIYAERNVDNVYGAYFRLAKTRGSQATPAPVQYADSLGSVLWHGRGSASMADASAGIDAWVDATPSGNNVPTALSFKTMAAGDTMLRNRMILSSSGNLRLYGNLAVSGSKAAVVETASYGKRRLSAVESPGVWFEDFGNARLGRGSATIKIEPIFLETVNTEVPYHIFLTPNGNCKGLYVAKKGKDHFEVKESGHGKSDITFDYRIVAKRKGYEADRLAEIEDVPQAKMLNRNLSESSVQKQSTQIHPEERW